MNILFPGRHHILTRFQYDYLSRIISEGLKGEKDVNGEPLGLEDKVDSIIFAVTSSDHSNTRRNPVPFYQRAMALQEFSSTLGVPSYIYDIDAVSHMPDFAHYTLERIKHRSDGKFNLTPENTLVLCSTPVLEMYEQLGFKVLPAELADRKTESFKAKLPWEIVESIAASEGDWRANPLFRNEVHPASQRLWETYNIGDKVRLLFSDRMIGDDGDLTETRDNNSYVRAMDEIAGIKYERAAPFIRPGRIGDIGCAVGSWIRLASLDERFRESDLFGVEISRPLYEICEQRKTNGDFKNPYAFFSRKNAVDGLVFEPNSMNTIHTSSLTHEIWSYAGPKALRDFIRNRYIENLHGGVWVNQDVVGPANGDEIVYMHLNAADGVNDNVFVEFSEREPLAAHLMGLSTRARFLRFSRDFRRDEGYKLSYSIETVDGKEYVRLKLRDACEFMSKKDYTDNWESEMHEVFCSLTYSDWCNALREVGFKILPGSGTYKNQWIEDNRYKGKVELYRMDKGVLSAMANPEGHMLIVGEK